jgi:hypothetical protein
MRWHPYSVLVSGRRGWRPVTALLLRWVATLLWRRSVVATRLLLAVASLLTTITTGLLAVASLLGRRTAIATRSALWRVAAAVAALLGRRTTVSALRRSRSGLLVLCIVRRVNRTEEELNKPQLGREIDGWVRA